MAWAVLIWLAGLLGSAAVGATVACGCFFLGRALNVHPERVLLCAMLFGALCWVVSLAFNAPAIGVIGVILFSPAFLPLLAVVVSPFWIVGRWIILRRKRGISE